MKIEHVRSNIEKAEPNYWEETYYSATLFPPYIKEGMFSIRTQGCAVREQ